ncbi:hypothetical protein Ciccas_006200 [Cichlidogyrus casuarinus]|uniref:Serpin domain-containing protein n=1 Tax=Cichlidogyrus casuarinus TaxID=1844966 RepID=A0ABD2Q6F5_9PLAT
MGDMDLRFDDTEFFEILVEMQPENIDLNIPSFSAKHSVDLVPGLQKTGIKTLFNGDADLSGMSSERVKVSSVKQSVALELNKDGLEASPVPSIGMAATSLDTQSRKQFNCDQPFAYVLARRSYDRILFVGEYNAPDPAYKGFSKIL